MLCVQVCGCRGWGIPRGLANLTKEHYDKSKYWIDAMINVMIQWYRFAETILLFED